MFIWKQGTDSMRWIEKSKRYCWKIKTKTPVYSVLVAAVCYNLLTIGNSNSDIIEQQ